MEAINENKKLSEIFDEYDASAPISNSCTEKDLENYAKNNNSTPSKLKAFNKVLLKIETDLNKYLLGTNLSVSKFKFKNSFSAGEKNRSAMTKVAFNKAVGTNETSINLNLNVNVNKLLKFPSLEVYSIVSALAYNSVLSGLSKDELNKVKANNESLSNEDVLFQRTSDSTKERNNQVQYESSKWLIQTYLKDFLPRAFGSKANIINLDRIAELVAEQLLNKMSESEIAQIPSLFFRMENLDNRATREARKYLGNENYRPYLEDNIYKARLSKIQDGASQLATNSDPDYYKNAKSLSAQEQFVALSVTFAGKNDKVKDALEGDFDNSNIELKNFCKEYADSFMASNQLNPIEIKFVNSGVCRFVENGDAQCVEIDLSAKELKGGSITELVMTLSHELTHAVDASINKINGNYNKYGGGLENTMSDNLDACDYPEAKDLLKKIQSHCYQLDPNERHARTGELSALKFLKNVYGEDAFMQEQIEQSVNQYASYQLQTVRCVEGLKNSIEKFEQSRDQLVAKGMSTKSRAYSMIEERINYLKNINLDLTMENQSIEDVYDIIKQKSNGDKQIDNGNQQIASENQQMQ